MVFVYSWYRFFETGTCSGLTDALSSMGFGGNRKSEKQKEQIIVLEVTVMSDSGKTAKRSSFSGSIGYVMAAAGSAVGLGNIWRFPYLAAKYGGGAFLLVYIILVVTFGYTLMLSETALGRKARKSAVGTFKAYGGDNGASRLGGWINAIVPMIIAPYYCVIGGWVFKYLFAYIVGDVKEAAGDSYFGNFITSTGGSMFWFIVFAAFTMVVIFMGVESGIEKVSKFMMPVLVVLAFVIAIYSMTRPGAAEGVKYFLIPNFHHFSWMTVVAALGQMFYSLSLAMGILYTYGSYMKDDVNIEHAGNQVQIFDSLVAILAGLMIIPAVFAYSGGTAKNLSAGPSLMFITLPKVFADMGGSRIVGAAFFVLVLFAALTSSISLAETCTSTFQDELKISRNKAAWLTVVVIFVLGSLSSLGYSALSNVTIIGMQMLDFFDFASNSVLMPIAAFATCLLVVRKVGLDNFSDIVKETSPFRREKMYRVFVKYIAPVFLMVILLSSILSAFGIFSL